MPGALGLPAEEARLAPLLLVAASARLRFCPFDSFCPTLQSLSSAAARVQLARGQSRFGERRWEALR